MDADSSAYNFDMQNKGLLFRKCSIRCEQVRSTYYKHDTESCNNYLNYVINKYKVKFEFLIKIQVSRYIDSRLKSLSFDGHFRGLQGDLVGDVISSRLNYFRCLNQNDSRDH